VIFAGLDFELGEGELLVLRGANGSGKTSLLRMVAGLIEPAAGRLALEGGPPDLTIAQQCHFVAHQDAVKPALTGAKTSVSGASFSGKAMWMPRLPPST
jgi:heme exporter protein A